ncbi:hypothetical protein S4A8_01695 [Salinisphaera sp. S4-8]|uniref:DMT family transporter n=1 Tax=Salinisphaera sp. S4-8 TaxID=633357 RepID=UPI0033427C30
MREILPIAIVVILFAGNILVGHAAATALPPFTLAFLRCLIALVAALLFFGRPAWRSRKLFWQHKGRLALIGISGIGLFNALLYASLHTASTTTVAVLEASIPIFTAIVAAIWLRERLGPAGWIGVGLSALGAIIVVTNGHVLDVAQSLSVGIGLMALAITAWIVYAMAATHGLRGLPALASMVPLTAAATLAILPLSAIEQIWLGGAGELSVRAIASALYLGLGPSFIAFILYNRALRTIGATAAALSLNALPVVVMLSGWAFQNQSITTAHLLGTALVIGGVSGVVLARRRPAAG